MWSKHFLYHSETAPLFRQYDEYISTNFGSLTTERAKCEPVGFNVYPTHQHNPTIRCQFLHFFTQNESILENFLTKSLSTKQLVWLYIQRNPNRSRFYLPVNVFWSAWKQKCPKGSDCSPISVKIADRLSRPTASHSPISEVIFSALHTLSYCATVDRKHGNSRDDLSHWLFFFLVYKNPTKWICTTKANNYDNEILIIWKKCTDSNWAHDRFSEISQSHFELGWSNYSECERKKERKETTAITRYQFENKSKEVFAKIWSAWISKCLENQVSVLRKMVETSNIWKNERC